MKFSADNKLWINLNIGYEEVGTAKILVVQMDRNLIWETW
jgi:hypothetical protein